jgi:hypothetical protein
MDTGCLVSYNHFIDCCPGLNRLEPGTNHCEAQEMYKRLMSNRNMYDFDEDTLVEISTHLATFLTPTPERNQIIQDCVAACTHYMQRRKIPGDQQRKIRRQIRTQLRNLLYADHTTHDSTGLCERVLDLIPNVVSTILDGR